MENEETKVPGQEGGAEQHEEKVVTPFATPIKFGGIEVKSEADVVKAQEAYKAQSARATKAEQEFAAYKKANPVKTEEKAKEVKEEKPKEESFLTKQANKVEFNKKVDTYIDGEFETFKGKANNDLMVKAFGGEVKGLVRTLVAQNGENVLKGFKVQDAFDAVIKDAIKKGNTKENNEAFNKAINLRNLNDGTGSIKDVEEVFKHFESQKGKPSVNGKKVDTHGFENNGKESTFESERKEIKNKVAEGKMSYRDSRSAIKKLQEKYVKLNR